MTEYAVYENPRIALPSSVKKKNRIQQLRHLVEYVADIIQSIPMPLSIIQINDKTWKLIFVTIFERRENSNLQ